MNSLNVSLTADLAKWIGDIAEAAAQANHPI
jgi:hypothetical protein